MANSGNGCGLMRALSLAHDVAKALETTIDELFVFEDG